MPKLIELAAYGGPKTVTAERPHFKWPILGKEEEEAVVTLLRTGKISIYDRSGIVADLEDAFCKFCGSNFALSTNSGTAALYAAYFALNFEPGDEVVVPTYTFPATVTPLLHFPVKIMLADADPRTGNVTADSIEQCLTKKTKAVVVTHMWGLPCKMDEIVELCKGNDIDIVEDVSHGLGATFGGKHIGTFGKVGCMSLQANKMACAGEGGVLITDDQEIFDRATLFTTLRKRPKQTVVTPTLKEYWETGFGIKMKIHPLAAAISLQQLLKVPLWIKKRHERLNFLSEMLCDAKGIEPPASDPKSFRGAWYGYKPLFRSEEVYGISIKKYVSLLKAEGLDVHLPGTRPLHQTPLFLKHNNPRDAWRKYVHDATKKITQRCFPGADSYYSRALSVPTFTLESMDLVRSYGLAFQKIGGTLGKNTL